MNLTKIQRDKVIHVRFTDDQHKILQDMAVKYGNGKVSTCCFQIVFEAIQTHQKSENCITQGA